jgi:hypothetical protein
MDKLFLFIIHIYAIYFVFSLLAIRKIWRYFYKNILTKPTLRSMGKSLAIILYFIGAYFVSIILYHLYFDQVCTKNTVYYDNAYSDSYKPVEEGYSVAYNCEDRGNTFLENEFNENFIQLLKNANLFSYDDYDH